MASDSRTNAGNDQVHVFRKMHTFVRNGDRVLALATSGSLSLSQSVIEVLRRDFDKGAGLASCGSLYDAARLVGEAIRKVSDMDRDALERDGYQFNVNLLLGGQVGAQAPGLYLVYPQGNQVSAGEGSPYLQIGESKYGRPILDRGIHYAETTLEQAVKYALISLDSTMRSNATVGPPIDLLVVRSGALRISGERRLTADDPDLKSIRAQWEQALRKAVHDLPGIRFE